MRPAIRQSALCWYSGSAGYLLSALIVLGADSLVAIPALGDPGLFAVGTQVTTIRSGLVW